MKIDYDVIIVGPGLAGLTTAKYFTEKGINEP
jgi:ribulose 1,5-bisphosphate synthetase/thiazole synthase